MEKATAKAIKAAAEETGIECDVHLNYSGRGMMGRYTAGVSTNSLSDLLRLVATASVRVKEAEDWSKSYGDNDIEQTDEEFVADLDVRTDTLGGGMVAY